MEKHPIKDKHKEYLWWSKNNGYFVSSFYKLDYLDIQDKIYYTNLALKPTYRLEEVHHD